MLFLFSFPPTDADGNVLGASVYMSVCPVRALISESADLEPLL